MKRDYQSLLRIFRKLGARDAERHSSADAEGDDAHLARYLLLRQAWSMLVEEDDVRWIDAWQPAANPDEPLAGMRPALDRLLAHGIDRADLTEVVRTMQYDLLYRLCCLLDEPSLARESLGPAAADVHDVEWRLFELDDGGAPARPLDALQDVVQGLDPTGREMRPRKRRADSTRRVDR